MKIFKFIFIPILVLTNSCSNNSEDDLTNPQNLSTITQYSASIKPIIDNNCLNCHGAIPSNGASNSLTTYTQVKDAVLNENLIGRISSSPGNGGFMPLGGIRLPQGSIDLVNDWNTDGLLE